MKDKKIAQFKRLETSSSFRMVHKLLSQTTFVNLMETMRQSKKLTFMSHVQLLIYPNGKIYIQNVKEMLELRFMN